MSERKERKSSVLGGTDSCAEKMNEAWGDTSSTDA